MKPGMGKSYIFSDPEFRKIFAKILTILDYTPEKS